MKRANSAMAVVVQRMAGEDRCFIGGIHAATRMNDRIYAYDAARGRWYDLPENATDYAFFTKAFAGTQLAPRIREMLYRHAGGAAQNGEGMKRKNLENPRDGMTLGERLRQFRNFVYAANREGAINGQSAKSRRLLRSALASLHAAKRIANAWDHDFTEDDAMYRSAETNFGYRGTASGQADTARHRDAYREFTKIGSSRVARQRNPASASDYRVTVISPSGHERKYTSEHRWFGGMKPVEIAMDEARRASPDTIIEVREANLAPRTGNTLYRYRVVGNGSVKSEKKSASKANPHADQRVPSEVGCPKCFANAYEPCFKQVQDTRFRAGFMRRGAPLKSFHAERIAALGR